MHVDTEAGWTVCAGIGEMLEGIRCEKTGDEIEANAGCADDLYRPSEVLLPEFVVAKECAPASHVNRKGSPGATQCKARNQSDHEAGVLDRRNLPYGSEESHVEFRSRVRDLPLPWKTKHRRDIILLKVLLLVLPKR